jgi:hypothetical protein
MKKFKIVSSIYGTAARIYPRGNGASISQCAILIEAGAIDANWYITRTKYTYIYDFGIRECNLNQWQQILVMKLIVSGFML